eukprot:CAMPEP_0176372020 /NCGR_PEP_ID=MMETSP0126-20121128/25105_1 /TAXON_ID=141414 ORGANISM="Strombidinopsis acuminatum, Strain SPMC142" /NCGR_SAMPLE_ID=MMETSP0126 /ASSEMBLY_ACC=CAM_ASM_000229 /LENGTH=441 /DNA_ID=CAMNT_0017731709 /DNA_START=295 /DNA_END=1623 /DNA_ORIENTATION=+
MQAAGFTGDNLFMAAHSLGGVMAQYYNNEKDTDYTFKGQVLMGSVLQRKYRSIQDDGTTLFDFTTPTLTLGGTKDGLMRITRVAESQWHQVNNINDEQANKYPVVALNGVSHAQFGDYPVPSFVVNNDLTPDIEYDLAHKKIGENMAAFCDFVVNGVAFDTSESAEILAPLVSGMEMEGSYNLKEPCYTEEDVNPPSNTCSHGSPWMAEHAVKTFIGEFEKENIHLSVDDNFHRSSSLFPFHHPSIETSCATTGSSECTVEVITNTMLTYKLLEEHVDTGKTPIAAKEMRAKMKSIQAYRTAAGEELMAKKLTKDLISSVMNARELTKLLGEWAYANVSEEARANFDLFGESMVMEEDRVTGNGGLWVYKPLKFEEADDRSEMDVSSLACPTKMNALIPIFRGMHYCKLISPYHAMEWIYIDGLKAKNGLSVTEAHLAFYQ